MNTQAKAFLESYPLTQEGQEVIDRANNGDIIPLVRTLTGAVTAVAKLRTRQLIRGSSATIGLANYYRNQINALIECVKDPDTKRSLEQIYKGD